MSGKNKENFKNIEKIGEIMAKKSGKIVEVEQPKNAIVVYTNVNFDGLNDAIETLGDASKELSKEEKELGCKLLEEWKHNVLDRLSNKEHELEQIENFIGVREQRWGGYNFELPDYQTLRENMAKMSKTEKLYNKYLKTKEDVELHKLEEEEKPEYNPHINQFDNDRIYGEYEARYIEWNIKHKQLNYVKTIAWNTWIREMRKTQEIKDFLTGLNSYRAVLKQYKNEAQVKCNKAKINLSITSKSIRESINEILEFARQIK